MIPGVRSYGTPASVLRWLKALRRVRQSPPTPRAPHGRATAAGLIIATRLGPASAGPFLFSVRLALAKEIPLAEGVQAITQGKYVQVMPVRPENAINALELSAILSPFGPALFHNTHSMFMAD